MPLPRFERSFVSRLADRLRETPWLIQILIGPRQVGKTTGVRQLLGKEAFKAHYASADDLLAADREWLLEQWQRAALLGDGALLVIDEIQKVPNWSETIKALWDRHPGRLRVVLLGSSALHISSGMTESLAGRFELTRVLHWRYAEVKQAFGYDLERYLSVGGYPGSVQFENDPDRWYSYMKESIFESVIGKDILSARRIGNPALFRQAFDLLCHYPAQEVSYTKLLGQLQDKGNTDLVKTYIDLYSGAFLMHSLQKYSSKPWKSKSSSPKILPACPALYSMMVASGQALNAQEKGRVFELAVGAELMQLPGNVYYWRERSAEVDYVYVYRGKTVAVEVKSGRKKSTKGLQAFCSKFPEAHPVIVSPEIFEAFSADPHAVLERLTA